MQKRVDNLAALVQRLVRASDGGEPLAEALADWVAAECHAIGCEMWEDGWAEGVAHGKSTTSPTQQ